VCCVYTQAMAATAPDDFASRAWRVEGIRTYAEKHGSKGKVVLVMKYRKSATHISKMAAQPFRSSDAKYDKLWDTKEEALQEENVQRFRDFVQRGFAHGGGSTPKPKRPRTYMEADVRHVVHRVEPKLRGGAHGASTTAAGSLKVAAATAQRMANFVTRPRKLGFAHGAVKQPNRKEQRKESQAIQNAEKQLMRSAYRQEQIAILQYALHNGTCTDVLVPLDEGDEGSGVSHTQSTRVVLQCIVVLQFFMLLEDLALQNGEELPEGNVYEIAAQAGE